MGNDKKKNLWLAAGMLAAFVLWTILVRFVDVRPIGPQGSSVGFGAVNGAVHGLTGTNMGLYMITDWLGLIPLGTVLGFALLGLIQWIQRKGLWKVDADLLLLGGFFLAVLAVYAFFEIVVINYRPVLIEGNLEASYPSSTTMLALCVMPAAGIQLRLRMKHQKRRKWIGNMIKGFTAFMVVGRMLSGVHWLTDIIGGILVSGGLVLMYGYLCRRICGTSD